MNLTICEKCISHYHKMRLKDGLPFFFILIISIPVPVTGWFYVVMAQSKMVHQKPGCWTTQLHQYLGNNYQILFMDIPNINKIGVRWSMVSPTILIKPTYPPPPAPPPSPIKILLKIKLNIVTVVNYAFH